jgi:2-methylisocitrate lyase-like PEP mutase family enzyme
MELIAREVQVPALINMVEGGLTPTVSHGQLAAMGYRIALYANSIMRVAAESARRALAVICETGDSRQLEEAMLPWADRQRLVGLSDWEQLSDAIHSRATAFAKDQTRRARLGSD